LLVESAAGVSVQADLVKAKSSEAAETKASVPCHQQQMIASTNFNERFEDRRI